MAPCYVAGRTLDSHMPRLPLACTQKQSLPLDSSAFPHDSDPDAASSRGMTEKWAACSAAVYLALVRHAGGIGDHMSPPDSYSLRPRRLCCGHTHRNALSSRCHDSRKVFKQHTPSNCTRLTQYPTRDVAYATTWSSLLNAGRPNSDRRAESVDNLRRCGSTVRIPAMSAWSRDFPACRASHSGAG